MIHRRDAESAEKGREKGEEVTDCMDDTDKKLRAGVGLSPSVAICAICGYSSFFLIEPQMTQMAAEVARMGKSRGLFVLSVVSV